ncbi:hypothetical protein LT336_00748 [Spiroplasma sp. JKS002671]|nr:hypothetical protein [Spiroplasma sp. JKS002671]MCL8210996.1 hypothetical protein [Spiroplasma sp. JKS002671]
MQENFIYRMNQKLFNTYKNRSGWNMKNENTLVNDKKTIFLKKDNRITGIKLLEVRK